MSDKSEHGTDHRGERHPQAKLTEDDVRQIRVLAGQMTRDELAQKFGVSSWAISDVLRGNRWGWLE